MRPQIKYTTRPLPSAGPEKSMGVSWKSGLLKRSWITPNMFDIMGVLYSSIYMGAYQEAKSVPLEAFRIAHVTPHQESLDGLLAKKYISYFGSGEDIKYKLTAPGIATYKLLYWAEEKGEWPLNHPVAPDPEEVIARHYAPREAKVAHGLAGTETVETLRHKQIMEEFRILGEKIEVHSQDIRDRQDMLYKLFDRLMTKLEAKEREDEDDA